MQQAEHLHKRRASIRVGVFLALVLEAQGAHREAVRALERAFSLLEMGGGARLILDAGPSIAELIKRLPASSTNTLVRARLYGESSLRAVEGDRKPLSQRELEILRLMHDGLSNHEISVILYVSQGTVKQHVHHIYQKLGVSSRTRALTQARRLGLIPQDRP
jgi:LuxR family maltose regulon positive regulatory protein